jgi:hypothetical protein
LTVNDLRIEIKAAGRAKVDITVRNEHGGIVLTDQANLASIDGRRRTAKDLCGKLRDFGIEKTPPELEQELQAAWAQFAEAQEKEAAEQARASNALEDQDPDSRELRRLEGMPADLLAEAEALVRSPELMKRLVDGIASVGVAGERELGATLYLIGTSRKLARPLAGRVKGPSSSGKSFIIERVARLMPPESVVFATQITPQALFHMPPDALRHKFIVAGERSRKDDDDVAEATRALREMISSGRLSKLMPVKFGNELQTVLIEQEGPIAYVESTTLSKVFAEDENRCISLFTDERDEQTRRVMKSLATNYACIGIDIGAGTSRVVLLNHAIQRMLARKDVVVPSAPKLAELLPHSNVEVRRAFPHLMSLVQASALLHQYQRSNDSAGRVIATREDYQLARHLLSEPMRRLLGGGISAPARRFHERLGRWFGLAQFSTKDARRKEQASRASVYDWLSELREAGAIELIEPGRGSKPSTWLAGELPQDEDVLPSESILFGEGSVN